ncbi:hypothetical protein GCM10023205_77980 [Yinghuangia aomiensis]|uniref:Uncharacterized protein n=1 Tax=Yinghuangia aomiensis TaxID=676205 RepID=A0ABP9IB30_9ACTN
MRPGGSGVVGRRFDPVRSAVAVTAVTAVTRDGIRRHRPSARLRSAPTLRTRPSRAPPPRYGTPVRDPSYRARAGWQRAGPRVG